MLNFSQNGCTGLKELDLHDVVIKYFLYLRTLEPITSLEMDTLTNIVVSLPDTIAIVATPKEVVFHSCPMATTDNDIFLAIVIGLIVLIGLAIIGHYVCKGIATSQSNKINELKSRQEHEIFKLTKEAEIKTAANQFNAEQTNKQREWISESDKLKNDIERQNVRLKEAEVSAEISKLEKNSSSKQDNTQS